MPASAELIEHHAQEHSCGDVGSSVVACPCGQALAVRCDACGRPVFLATVSRDEWCVHAVELWETFE